jgi:hypothetical protein
MSESDNSGVSTDEPVGSGALEDENELDDEDGDDE